MENLNQIKHQSHKALQLAKGLLIGLGIAMSGALFAQNDTPLLESVQSLAAVEQTAKVFLEELQTPADKQGTKVIVSNIDPRTRLAVCDSELEAFLAPGAHTSGKTTVGVKCEGSRPWKVFLSARVHHYQEAWVATRDLKPSDTIGKNDLERRRVSVERLRFTPQEDLALIVNASPKRPIREGSVIFAENICLVCRGDQVSVAAENDFLSINVEGIALSDAALGETAQIRNSQSKKVFGAIVTGKNQLSVSLSPTNRLR